MAELLLPVEIESEALAELLDRMPAAGFAGLKIATRLPSPRPAEFMRIVALGGSQRDLVTDLPLLRLEAFAMSETRAAKICGTALGVLQAAARTGYIGDTPCYGTGTVTLPQNSPIPSVPDRYRYIAQLTFAARRTTA